MYIIIIIFIFQLTSLDAHSIHACNRIRQMKPVKDKMHKTKVLNLFFLIF